jgi:cell division protein FtsQ
LRVDDPVRRGLRRWAIAGICVVALGTGVVTATYTPLFEAKDVRLEGEGAIARDELLTMAGVGEGTNVFHLDTLGVERRLERDPRILDAQVMAGLPDSLVIRVVRRKPVAVVGSPAQLVGADGVVIGPATRIVGLPTLMSEGGRPAVGPDLATGAATAAAMTVDLRRAVESVRVGRDGGIDVRLSAGFSADLGDASDLGAKAASLAALLDWIADRGVTVLSADLTVPGSPTALLEGHAPAVPIP